MMKPENVCLAIIREVQLDSPSAHQVLPIPTYSKTGALNPVDINSIQCVVGCVEDRGKWGLVDRSGPLAHGVYISVETC